ncbi:MAG: hypothetical protein CMJ69_08210 [Planctomycetaceae bacterium]|nr:hypothetical protein [Planctomycetaceae bacterium]
MPDSSNWTVNGNLYADRERTNQPNTYHASSSRALADCPESYGARVERVVEFRTGSDVSSLSDRPVRLRFVLKDADLYSFPFMPKSTP